MRNYALYCCAVLCAVLLSTSANPDEAPPAPLSALSLNMGMLGDSLTDEYLPAPNPANTDLAAYNWVQILALTRAQHFNFGEFRGPDNYWSDVRDAGFEYNWAKVGTAASSATRLRIARIFKMKAQSPFMGSSYIQQQVIGMAPYVQRGEVNVVFIGAGSNDFFYQTSNFTMSGKAQPLKNAVISQDFVDSVAGSLLAAVDSLQAAGDVKVLLALVPMGTASEDNGSVEAVLAGIAAVNEILVAGASERGVGVVDLFGFASDPERSNADGSVNIGGMALAIDSAATEADLAPGDGRQTAACNSAELCALPSHANHYRAEDGLHPNTAIQGLIANQVLQALNENFAAKIELLTDEEILSLTGLP